jgi:RNA polymerase sigma-70 factor, ECF subfamily
MMALMSDYSVEIIWERFHTPLERFVRMRISDSMAADDVIQDVYVKIHSHLNTLRDDERLQSWVYQIARYTIYDYYRRQKMLYPLDHRVDDSTSTAPTDDLSISSERLAASLRTVIDALPERYRQAILLSELDGLKQREVAQRLGISVSGAKSRVQRGRALLREMMMACCWIEFDRYGHIIDHTPRGSSCRYEVENSFVDYA